MKIMDTIKLTIATFTSALIAYLQPLHSAIHVLIAMFFIDMLLGIITDRIVNKKRISGKKFLMSFINVAVYLCIIVAIYFIGERMDNAVEALFVDRMVTYVFIYFYSINVLKNLKELMPKSHQISFLYFMIGLEFVKRIPSLGEFLEKEKNEKQDKDNDQNTE